MKLKLKKLGAVLVTSLMGITSICPVFAAESEAASSVLIETEDCSNAKEEFMDDIDTIINLLKVNLGRDNMNIEDAVIGQPFLVDNSDIYIFPVLVNGNIERLIQMTKGKNGYNRFAISDFFADELNNLSEDTYEILANDKFDVFAKNEEDINLIYNNSNDEDISEPLMPLTIEEDKNTADIKDTFVDLSAVPMPLMTATGSGKWNNNFPIVGQGNYSKSCWAACMASILKGYGVDTSVDDVLKKTGKTSYQGSYFTEVKGFYKNCFGYSSETFNQYTLKFSDVASEINNKRAIHQELVSDTKGDHAVVIYGYQYATKNTTTSGIVSLMDPNLKGCRVDCSFYDVDEEFEYNGRTSATGVYKIKK